MCFQSVVFIMTSASSHAMYQSFTTDDIDMGEKHKLTMGWNSTSWCPPDGPCEAKSCNVSDWDVYLHKTRQKMPDGYCTHDGAPVFFSEDSKGWYLSFPKPGSPEAPGIQIMAASSRFVSGQPPVHWCLSVDDSDLLSIQYCDGSPEQKFTLPSSAYDGNTSSRPYLGTIVSSSGKCLESFPMGSAPIVRECDGNHWQLFRSCRTVTTTPNGQLETSTNCHPAPAPEPTSAGHSQASEPPSLAFV